MSNQYLKLRRSSVPNKIPDTGSLDFGELALNTYDGLVFMKKSGSSGEEVISIGSGGGGGTINTGSLATTGSNRFIGNQIITGSLTVTNGITGSLFGTASWSLNALNPFTFIATGSVTASVNIANDIFLIKSASVNFLTITNNTTTIQNDIFLIKDLSNRTVFTISQSIVYFPTQSATLSNSLASAGGIYFTSSSFYVGLEE
jgi:hypothetical protein